MQLALRTLLILACFGSMLGCSDPFAGTWYATHTQPSLKNVTGVTLSSNSLFLVVGGAAGTLTATITPSSASNKNLLWTSQNTAVATVTSAGVVSPVGMGTTNVTVTTVNGGFQATSLVTVSNTSTPVTGVTLSPNSLFLVVGGATGTLTATITPSSANNKNLLWTSQNTAVATVTSAGGGSPVGTGTTTITVTTVDGGFQATSPVTVSNTSTPVTGVTLSTNSLLLVAGGSDGITANLIATVSPATATNTNVTWSTNNASVATVSSSGTVNSLHWGNAVITVTTADGARTANCNVQVTNNFYPAVRTLTTGILAGVTSLPGGYLDGNPGTALFKGPWGIVSDGTNLYVADEANDVIRAIQISSGNVSTIAGVPGTQGQADASVGTSATFEAPMGITTDGTSLYVVDYYHNIRKIALASPHAVSTVTGLGISSPGFVDGDKNTAKFNFPTGITTDGTNLYVADNGNNAIRKVVISTGYVTTLAGGTLGNLDGTGSAARFNSPYGVATDGTNLYIADQGNHEVRKLVLKSNLVSTLAGSASLNYPVGVATDGFNVYVSEYQTSAILRIRIADGGVSTTADLSGIANVVPIYGIALDQSHLFFSSTGGGGTYGINNLWQIQ